MRYTFTKKAPKVSAAAAKNSARPALEAAWFDADAGELRVTDSYIACRMPVSVDPGDATGWISLDALDRSIKRDAGGLAANGTAAVYEVPAGDYVPDADYIERRTVATFPRVDAGQAPNLPQLWPVDRDGFTVGVNAGFLKRLADSIGAADGVVQLTFQSDDAGRPNPLRPIIVRGMNPNEVRSDELHGLAAPEGLLMPVRVS